MLGSSGGVLGAGGALRLSPNASFWALVLGTFSCYLLYGIVQEQLFSTPGLKALGWYVCVLLRALFFEIGISAELPAPMTQPHAAAFSVQHYRQSQHRYHVPVV
jgi:hypothetical protein